MLYVALLSGGKDSCFNLLHCARNGHELVAAASLGPGPDKGEIDSYMYQTVGQDAIELVAEALDVPLFRRIITGHAVNQGAEYGSRLTLYSSDLLGDETEDLFALLSEVKTAFPDVQGVSVGAILSNYQRVRVEHVCQRLSLTPLSYLWQRDQTELLQEMIQSGLEAVLIKVAGIGLNTRHLGKSLAEMQPTLMMLHSMYGAHVCGEGGEYESLTLDSPLFKRRIVLEDVETVIHTDSDFAVVAYLRIKAARLEDKSAANVPELPVPSLLSSEDEEVRSTISKGHDNASQTSQPSPSYRFLKTNSPSTGRVRSWIVITDIEAPDKSLSIEEEVKYCFRSVIEQLNIHMLDVSHIANMTLLISSMEDFSIINSVYASFFGSSPPARACVGVDLPKGVHLRMECIAHDVRGSRQSLHVQSLSYWAPANIGPYSQAISVGGRIFVSGQIGLIPSSNCLPSPPALATELALSLRHVRNIIKVVQDSFVSCKESAIQGIISWLASYHDLIPVQLGMAVSTTVSRGNIPTLFVVVKSLPKGALVETQVILHSKYQKPDDPDDPPTVANVHFSSGMLVGLNAQWQCSYIHSLNNFVILICCTNDDDVVSLGLQLASISPLSALWASTTLARLFYTASATPNTSQLFSQVFEQLGLKQPPLTTIPSRLIATWDNTNWDYALFFIG